MSSYIYIAHYGDKIKVGTTKNLNRRMSNLRTGNPDIKLHSWFRVNNSEAYKLEKYMHKIIEDKNYKFEHFSVRRSEIPKIIEKIKGEFKCKNISYEYSSNKYSLDEKKETEKISNNQSGIINRFNITLRYYQEEIVEKMKTTNRGKIILATGLGKSIVFMKYICDIFSEKKSKEEKGKNVNENKKIIVLSGSIDLCNQLCENMRKFYQHSYIYNSDYENIYLLNEESIRNFKENIVIFTTYNSSVKFLDINWHTAIYDECHRAVINTGCNSMFNEFLREAKVTNNFFFTATPKIITKSLVTMNSVKLFGEELYKMDIRQGIEAGYLNDYAIHFHIHTDKISSLKGILLDLPKTSKAIVYFPSPVDTMIDIFSQLCIPNIGIVCSKNNYKKNNSNVIEDFKRGKFNIMFSCQMLREGFDDINVDTVIHYKVSNSSIDVIQKNGRALRIAEGKRKSRIIFITNNIQNETKLANALKIISISDPQMRRNILDSCNISSNVKVFKEGEEIDYFNDDENKKCIDDFIEIVKIFDKNLKQTDTEYLLDRNIDLILKYKEEFGEFPFTYRKCNDNMIKRVKKIHNINAYKINSISDSKACPYPFPYNTLHFTAENLVSRCMVIHRKEMLGIPFEEKSYINGPYYKYREKITSILMKNFECDKLRVIKKNVHMFSKVENPKNIKECYFYFSTKIDKYYSYDELWKYMRKNGKKNK